MPEPRCPFIWYELMTADPAGAKRFYDSVIGWQIAEQSVAPGIDYRMIGRSRGGMAGGVLTLDDAMRANGARPLWIGYLHSRDVDASCEAIAADGGAILRAAWNQPGVGRLAMLADPWGAPFYLMDPLPPEGEPDAQSSAFSVDRPQHVRWNELATSDPEGAIAFYRKHFNIEQRDSMPMGEMGDYQFLWSHETMIGAVLRKPSQMPESRWTFYVGVEDIDRAAAAIGDGGGSVLMGPHEIPGGEFSLNAVDPAGASFALVGPRHAKEQPE